MTTKGIREVIHKAVDDINDPEFLKAIYTILTEKLINYKYNLSPEQEEEIDKRIIAHKSGKSKSYNWPQAKKIIESKLKK
jgi:hypothetical protein